MRGIEELAEFNTTETSDEPKTKITLDDIMRKITELIEAVSAMTVTVPEPETEPEPEPEPEPEKDIDEE